MFMEFGHSGSVNPQGCQRVAGGRRGLWGRRPPGNGAGEALHPGRGARVVAAEPARDWRCPGELSWHPSDIGSGGINRRHHRESAGGIHRRFFPLATARARATSQRDRWPTSSKPRAGRSRCRFRGPARGPSQVAHTTRAAGASGRLSLQPQSWLQVTVIGGIDKFNSM